MPWRSFFNGEAARVSYFAYGANMARQQLIRKGVEPAGEGSPAFVEDAQVRISFQHRSGFATLMHPGESCPVTAQPLSCSQPHGVVFWLRKEDLHKLARHETGYRLRLVDLVMYDGRPLNAYAFVTSPGLRLPEGVPPTQRYLRLLQRGAREHDLAAEYQSWLHAIPSAEVGPLPEKYFDTASARTARYILLALGLAFVAVWFSDQPLP